MSGVPSVKLIPLKQLRRRYCRHWSFIDRGAIEEIVEPKCWKSYFSRDSKSQRREQLIKLFEILRGTYKLTLHTDR